MGIAKEILLFLDEKYPEKMKDRDDDYDDEREHDQDSYEDPEDPDAEEEDDDDEDPEYGEEYDEELSRTKGRKEAGYEYRKVIDPDTGRMGFKKVRIKQGKTGFKPLTGAKKLQYQKIARKRKGKPMKGATKMKIKKTLMKRSRRGL
jgi:hypothetical protein